MSRQGTSAGLTHADLMAMEFPDIIDQNYLIKEFWEAEDEAARK